MSAETELDPELRAQRIQNLTEDEGLTEAEAAALSDRAMEAKLVEARQRTTLEKLVADGVTTAERFAKLSHENQELLLMDEDRRQAYKMNHLIQKRKVDTFEASGMSRTEFDETLKKDFDRDYHQNYFRPPDMKPKEAGNRAEGWWLELFERAHHDVAPTSPLNRVHFRPGSAYQDQGPRKADHVLTIDGVPFNIDIQTTTQSDPELQAKKFAALPETTIPVVLPEGLDLVLHEKNLSRDRGIIRSVLQQIATELKRRRLYPDAWQPLDEAVASLG